MNNQHSADIGAVVRASGGPILVTGAAGRLGGVGGTVVEILRQRNLPVRAMVRREDERADALRAIGAEVVVGDLKLEHDLAVDLLDLGHLDRVRALDQRPGKELEQIAHRNAEPAT